MNDKVDIVIQGGFEENTFSTALHYLNLSFVNDIIISTWEYEKEKITSLPLNERIHFVLSELPAHDGGGNVNYQIISSAEGLKLCTTPTAVKMRSDQTIALEDMEKLYKFYNKFHEKNEIFVLGIGTHFPYHPQDHVFWGNKEDVMNLFTVPQSEWKTYEPNMDFGTTFRSPMYLGAYYYSLISEVAQKHWENPREYLFDASPKRAEALEEYDRIREVGFKPFPRVSMAWHKYGGGYMYDGYYAQGERYYDEEWE